MADGRRRKWNGTRSLRARPNFDRCTCTVEVVVFERYIRENTVGKKRKKSKRKRWSAKMYLLFLFSYDTRFDILNETETGRDCGPRLLLLLLLLLLLVLCLARERSITLNYCQQPASLCTSGGSCNDSVTAWLRVKRKKKKERKGLKLLSNFSFLCTIGGDGGHDWRWVLCARMMIIIGLSLVHTRWHALC